MAPRPRWWHTLQASKAEVLLAVDLYNRSGNERQLEAFIVHMNLGWMKLLQARTDADGGEMIERDARGWRRKHPEGGFLYKSLRVLLAEQLDATDPRLNNIVFFQGLRNQIEHRHEARIAALVAGRTQALLINYEETLVEWFGPTEALGSELRFPLFVSTITEDAASAVKALRSQVPKGVLDWVQDFDTALEPDIRADQRFDFRIYLVPHTGPKTSADAAMTFIRASDLTTDQRALLDQVQTIIREKQVPVEDLNGLKAGEVVEQVSRRLDATFNMHMHTQAWKFFGVRPATSALNRASTKPEFCRYNSTFEQYTYTPAWVEYLVRHLSDAEQYAAVRGWRPEATPPS
ncbi:DUF3644 domain-containing protein [Agrococcus jenensis]|nr:DUF3644 domain-containing protein [Agrococcus jenensis]